MTKHFQCNAIHFTSAQAIRKCLFDYNTRIQKYSLPNRFTILIYQSANVYLMKILAGLSDLIITTQTWMHGNF